MGADRAQAPQAHGIRSERRDSPTTGRAIGEAAAEWVSSGHLEPRLALLASFFAQVLGHS